MKTRLITLLIVASLFAISAAMLFSAVGIGEGRFT
jgi:hypothetical protein